MNVADLERFAMEYTDILILFLYTCYCFYSVIVRLCTVEYINDSCTLSGDKNVFCMMLIFCTLSGAQNVFFTV